MLFSALKTSLPYEAKQNTFKHKSKLNFSQLSVVINTVTVKHVSVCPVLYLDG